MLLGYYNPIYVYPREGFLDDAKAAGADGLIIVDLPPEADEELCLPAIARGLNFIRLATPTTDDKRLPAVLANTSGFLYYVSITGITGSAAPDVRRRSLARCTHQEIDRPAHRGGLRREDAANRPKPSPPVPTAWWWARRWLTRSRKAWVRRANRTGKTVPRPRSGEKPIAGVAPPPEAERQIAASRRPVPARRGI